MKLSIILVSCGLLFFSCSASRPAVTNENQAPVIVNWTDLLYKQPGLHVSGTGDNISITVRGINSLQAGTEPLFVLDGVIVGSGFRSVSHIDPLMVDSIEVVKDGSAASYGSRGANGVILVKLKRQ